MNAFLNDLKITSSFYICKYWKQRQEMVLSFNWSQIHSSLKTKRMFLLSISEDQLIGVN